MKLRKILIFGYTLEMGGAEKVLIDILEAFKDQVVVDLYLLKKEGSLLEKVPQNVSIHTLRKNIFQYVLFRFFPLFRKFTINRIVNKKQYDVAIGFMEGRSASWVADIKQNIVKIAWVHNDVSKFDIGISNHEVNESYHKMNTIICVSNESKSSFIKKFNIQEDKVKVIFNLIDEMSISEASRKYDINKSRFTFVSVAKLRKQKGHDRLLKVVSRLNQMKYEFDLWIIGYGPEEENLKRIASNLNLNNVYFYGLQNNPYPYIKAADCFILPSYFEGYGIVVKEALFLKKMIISTRVTGPTEILEGGRYGILVENSEEGLYSGMTEVLCSSTNVQVILNEVNNYHGDNDKILKQLEELLLGGE